MKGLIVIGYPGIGKSTCAKNVASCVYLESSFFDNKLTYCSLAMDIANQGKIVFVSSHKTVCEYFNTVPFLENVAKAVIFCPRRTMKDAWINKLEKRYKKTGLEKDYRALEFVRHNFDSSIVSLCSDYDNLPVYQPESTDYKLGNYIYRLKNKYIWKRRN